MKRKPKLRRLLLTDNQIKAITTCLYEWACLCDSEADMADGSQDKTLRAESIYLMKVLDSVQAQVRKIIIKDNANQIREENLAKIREWVKNVPVSAGEVPVDTNVET
jgi:hypothetical protein